MRIPPHYVLTPTITQHLQIIEANRQIIDSFPIPPEIETNIRRKSTLKSSLFSARIEGNPLTLDEFNKRPSADQKKREVSNIMKAINLISDRGSRDVSLAVLLKIHEIVMSGLINNSLAGQFRAEASAIYNSAGIAVYLPPPHRQINRLMEKLLKYANGDKEIFIPIKAVLAHYTFEKIHPFLDGNGRVGRLLLQLVLQKSGYGMKQLVPIEEYLEKHRSEYYRVLEQTENDVTDFVEFMLEAIAVTSEETKKQILNKDQLQVEDYLLPRRAEILNIIRDHRLVDFNQIKRRFMNVNERTLRYDLKKLTDQGLIRKRGTTKGVYYETTSN